MHIFFYYFIVAASVKTFYSSAFVKLQKKYIRLLALTEIKYQVLDFLYMPIYHLLLSLLPQTVKLRKLYTIDQ